MSNRNVMGSPVEAGLVTRAAQGLRYVLTGEAPDWFGPAEPMAPQAPQTAGRMFDYMPGINLNTRPRQEAQGGIDFEQLRALADGYDLLRLVIETRKDQIARLDWCVRFRATAVVSADDPRIAQAMALFRFPDREHDWSAWLRMLVEDLLVIDAPTIYPRRTVAGDLYALDIIDGATIKRILDEQGRTPQPPYPAYQQVLKGIPTSDYTRDELLYLPRNPRSHKVYGLSPVEQVVVTVNIALRRQMHQLAYYTEGNVPEALIGVPETWTPDQIGQFQAYWDTLLEGDLAQRRHARFVPATISKSFIQTKEAALTDAYDGWLARIICYAFSVSYQALTTDVNRATAETAEMQAHQEGLAPLAQWVKGVMDRVLAQVLGWPDLEFAWATEADIDPLTQAQVNQIYLATGVLTAAEVRAGLGLPGGTTMLAEKGAFKEVLPTFVKEGNPYHVPAGCPEGGQFCSAGGAGGGGAATASTDGASGDDAGSTAMPTTDTSKPASSQQGTDIPAANDIIDAGTGDQLADARLADKQDAGQDKTLPALSPEAEERAKENLNNIINGNTSIDTLSMSEQIDILQYIGDNNKDGKYDDSIRQDLWAQIIKDPDFNLTQPLKGQEIIDKLQNLPAVHQIQDLCQSGAWANTSNDDKQRMLLEVVNAIADVYGLPHQYTVQIGGLTTPGTGAQYNDATHTISIEPGLSVTDYRANLFAKLAHEMTHAWQDQYVADHIGDDGTSGLLARVYAINSNPGVYIGSPFSSGYGLQPNERQAYATEYYIMGNDGVILGYMGSRLPHTRHGTRRK